MLFNSAEFCLVFFPLVTGLYFLLPKRFRWALLLAASCWFYMAFVPAFILILGFTIGVDYVSGIAIERSAGKRRKGYLAASIVANVAVLAVFKYWDFLNGSLTTALGAVGITHHVPKLHEWTFFGFLPAGMVLPIGLSFHTFQSLSYTIEVYRGHQKAERRPGVFALYVMFYPQLVAGPIERPANLLDQLNAPDGRGIRSDPDWTRTLSGVRQMLWGFFKKLVIADRCAVLVNAVYGDVSGYDGLSLLLATYLFAFQIYCDFSGYTDIALGAARVMGFELMVNFRTPYRSASISEFWGRWHISLSSWFRDYLYIPLGGNRVTRWRWYLNLFIVFMVSGLWHGADWTFVIWGTLHGAYLVLALACAPVMAQVSRSLGLDRSPRLEHALNVFITFHLVVLAWVFFRATSASVAMDVIKGIALMPAGLPAMPSIATVQLPSIFGLTLGCVLLFMLIDPWCDALVKGERRPLSPAREALFLAATALCILLLGNHGDSQFIYFQF